MVLARSGHQHQDDLGGILVVQMNILVNYDRIIGLELDWGDYGNVMAERRN